MFALRTELTLYSLSSRRHLQQSREKDTSAFTYIYIRNASGDLKRKESDDESGEYSSVHSQRSMRWVRLSGEDGLALIARAKTLQRTTRTGLERFSGEEIDRCSLGRRTFVFYRASPPIERSSAPLRAECSTLPEGRGRDNARGSLVLGGKTVITSHFLSASTSYSALSAVTITAIFTMHVHISFFFRSFHYTDPWSSSGSSE